MSTMKLLTIEQMRQRRLNQRVLSSAELREQFERNRLQRHSVETKLHDNGSIKSSTSGAVAKR